MYAFTCGQGAGYVNVGPSVHCCVECLCNACGWGVSDLLGFCDFAEFHRVATKKQLVSNSREIAEFGDDQKLLGFGLFCFVRVELEEFREASGCNFPEKAKKIRKKGTFLAVFLHRAFLYLFVGFEANGKITSFRLQICCIIFSATFFFV